MKNLIKKILFRTLLSDREFMLDRTAKALNFAHNLGHMHYSDLNMSDKDICCDHGMLKLQFCILVLFLFSVLDLPKEITTGDAPLSFVDAGNVYSNPAL